MQHRSRMISPFAIGILFFCASLTAQEEPDLAKEGRLHNIYKQLNEAPTPEETWQKVLSEGSIQTYTIQQGDTLWGISETMFGDPNFYPKIWSLNGQSILNPHEINPEHIVQFIEGTVGEPPSMSLAAKGAANDGSESGIDDPNASVTSQEIPEGVPRSKPYKALPSSLAPWDYDQSALMPFEFHIKVPEKALPIPETYVDTYLQEGELPEQGVVSENEGGHAASGDEQHIFIKFINPPSQNRYLVVKEIGKVKDSVSGSRANQIQIQAEIELEQIVNASKTIYRAKVIKLLNQVDVGSRLIIGDLMVMSTKEESPVTAVKSTIVGGAYDEERHLFATDEVVFINLGTESGMAPGQILPVFRNQTLRNDDTDAIQNHRVIGKLKILKTTSKFSSALVTTAIEDIRVGDRTYTE